MKRQTLIVLLFITAIAAVLRFYRLGDVPVGLHRDEAFLGYNAYSILNTGRDMSGNLLPLHLESFLYSPAGYSYFVIPFIALFDLSAFSIRFPSALFGTLTVILTYFFIKELFNKEPAFEIGNLKFDIASIASAILGLSPWHINLSRTATENTVALFFIMLGVLFYLLFIKKSHVFLLLASFAAFILSLLLYQAPRAFLPLFVPFLLVLFPAKKFLRLSWVFYAVSIVLPVFLILNSSKLSLRIQTVSLPSFGETQLVIDEQLREDGVSGAPRTISRILHNKAQGYALQFLDNYLAHFSYRFLFTDKGFPDRYRVPNAGLLYLFELPLVLYGLYQVLTQKRRGQYLLLGWALLVPVGSALAFDDVPNLQRTLLMAPVFSFLSALGLIHVMQIIPRVFRLLLICAGVVIAVSVMAYLHQYYVHQVVHRPWFRHEGYKELVQTVNALLPEYKKAIITTRESAPAIFFLIFSKYDPSIFQKETEQSALRDFDRINFARYGFVQHDCPLREEKSGDGATILIGEKENLYVNYATCETPKYTQEISQIKRRDDTVIFRILKVLAP